MRRLRFILISALWIGAVAWYWDTSVPLVPTRTVPAALVHRFYGLSPANEVIIGPARKTTTIPPRYIGCGPLEFWKLPEGVKTRTLFTADDEIVSGPRGKARCVLLRREDRLCIVETETGREIATLPDIPDANECFVLDNHEQALIWTANELYFERGIGADFFIATRRVPGRTGFRPNATAVSLLTGQPDSRFDHLGKVGDIELSPDRQLALVRTSAAVSLCNAATGSVRWTAPENAARTNFKFSKDGSEVHLIHFTPPSLVTHSRRRAFDGQPLRDATRTELLKATGQVTKDGRYALLRVSQSYGPQMSRLIDQLKLFLARWNIRTHFRPNTTQMRLIETETQRVLGDFSQTSEAFFLMDNVGIASIADGQIHFYTLPPSRNWTWLALWTLVPPAALLLLFRLRQSIRSLPAIRQPAAGHPA